MRTKRRVWLVTVLAAAIALPTAYRLLTRPEWPPRLNAAPTAMRLTLGLGDDRREFSLDAAHAERFIRAIRAGSGGTDKCQVLGSATVLFANGRACMFGIGTCCVWSQEVDLPFEARLGESGVRALLRDAGINP